jgi:hypothetical protein
MKDMAYDSTYAWQLKNYTEVTSSNRLLTIDVATETQRTQIRYDTFGRITSYHDHIDAP